MEERRYRILYDFDKGAYRLLVWKEKDAQDESPSDWGEAAGRFSEHFYLPEGIKFKGEKDTITFLPNGRSETFSIYVTGRENRAFEIKTNGRAGHVAVSEIKEK